MAGFALDDCDRHHPTGPPVRWITLTGQRREPGPDAGVTVGTTAGYFY